ncbi:hypothetical protein Tco_0492185 [Tanacetum coccineum]
MGYFQIIRDDGSSRRYSSMIKMLQNIDREDLETLWKLVKGKHANTRLKEAYERVLSQRVIDLEKTKTSQAAEITEIEGEGLEVRKKKEGEDGKIDEIDQDAEVTLVDETQERYGDNLNYADPVTTTGEVVTTSNVVVSTAEVTTDSTTTTTFDELTLAQTLIEIKPAKPKAVTTAAIKTTTDVIDPRPRALQEKKIANIAEWDDVQAMMDVDYELAARLQAEEQGELTIEE